MDRYSPEEHVFDLGKFSGKRFGADDLVVCVYNGTLATNQDSFRMVFKIGDLFLKTVGGGDIVGIHAGQVLTVSVRNGNVAGERDAKVDFVFIGSDAFIFFGVSLDN